MFIVVETHGSACVLRVTVPRFTQVLSEAVRAEAVALLDDDTQTFLVDLGKVTHMDSAALGVLINLMKRVGRERDFELCAPSPAVRKLLRLTRMESVFRVHGSLAEGLDSHFIPRAQAS